MAGTDFKITGEKELLKFLKVLPEQLQRRVTRQALMASAKPIIKRAKANLSKHKRTGTLKKSVKAVSAGSKIFGGVGSGKEVTVLVGAIKANGVDFSRDGFYGRFLENGTSKQPARPWMRPALDSGRAEQQKILAKEFGRRTLKEVKRLARKIFI